MSTYDFLNRIGSSSDLSDIITKFFDEIMILYNLIGDKMDMVISSDSTSSIASFILAMSKEEDAIDLYNTMNNTFFTIYQDKYIIKMELSGRNISTTIYKAIP